MGFTQDTFAYLEDLEANNEKAWFEDNRTRYEQHWKEPALDFIADLSNRMAALSPSLRAEPKLNGSLRRINRDVRFSKDKSPYSARLHLVFWAGEHPNRSPGMHFVLSPDGVGYGAGQWSLPPDRLKALRARIMEEAEDNGLQAALDQAASVECRMGEPHLARVPKGYGAEGRKAELLRYKGFVARTHDKPSGASCMIGQNAADWVMEKTTALLPLIRWLAS
ncbi:MAG: DUF2461 domain-containing protein [Pseudomonadota bacterium]